MILLSLAPGCTITITPDASIAVNETTFSLAKLNTFLSQHVDKNSLINYPLLNTNSSGLNRSITQIATINPDSHSELFSTEQDRLTYWINGYNAAVLKTFRHSYFISSVSDVRAPFLQFFMPENSDFFYSSTRSRPSYLSSLFS